MTGQTPRTALAALLFAFVLPPAVAQVTVQTFSHTGSHAVYVPMEEGGSAPKFQIPTGPLTSMTVSATFTSHVTGHASNDPGNDYHGASAGISWRPQIMVTGLGWSSPYVIEGVMKSAGAQGRWTADFEADFAETISLTIPGSAVTAPFRLWLSTFPNINAFPNGSVHVYDTINTTLTYNYVTQLATVPDSGSTVLLLLPVLGLLLARKCARTRAHRLG